MTTIARFGKNERQEYIVATALENPSLTIAQLTEAAKNRFGNCTEASVRYNLKLKGIERSNPRPKGVKYAMDGHRNRSLKPKDKPQPKPQIRAAVHSYHGRSRLSASYVEL